MPAPYPYLGLRSITISLQPLRIPPALRPEAFPREEAWYPKRRRSALLVVAVDPRLATEGSAVQSRAMLRPGRFELPTPCFVGRYKDAILSGISIMDSDPATRYASPPRNPSGSWVFTVRSLQRQRQPPLLPPLRMPKSETAASGHTLRLPLSPKLHQNSAKKGWGG